MDALRKAIALCNGQAGLARRLNVSPSVVGNWLLRSKVPSHRVLAIEEATGGKVSRHDLRADLYPRPKRRKAA